VVRRAIRWLASPIGELSFIELIVLVDVEVPHIFVLGLDRRERTQRSAAKESTLTYFVKQW
jgi:hypothetical protein